MNREEWRRVVDAADVPPGSGRFVFVDGHELAVFHLVDPDRFVITRNSCPHAGGNLSAGALEGSVVTCPWHHWPFNVETGECTLAPHVVLRRYECAVRGGVVFALLPLNPEVETPAD